MAIIYVRKKERCGSCNYCTFSMQIFKYYRAPKTRPQNSTPKLDPKKGCPQKTLDTQIMAKEIFQFSDGSVGVDIMMCVSV